MSISVKNDYCQKACGNESSYCITWKNPQVCHGCNKLCGSGPPKPPGPKPPGPKTDTCATKCGTGSYCQNGVCHGCPTVVCGSGPPGPKPPVPKTDTCVTKCGTGSYCQNGVCHGCPTVTCGSGPKPPGPKPPGPKPPGPKTDTCATKCGSGSWCQNGVCHGCPTVTCGAGPPGGDRPGPPPKACQQDSDCDQNTWQYCRKGICASKPIPNHAFPHIAKPTPRPSVDDLTKLAISLHNNGTTTPSMVNYPSPAKKGRPFRLTLWHEGVKGTPLTNKNDLVKYMEQYIAFVEDKMFDRTFLQGGDPAIVDNSGNQSYPYAGIDFVIDNYLAKLPSYTTAGLLAIIDPKYIGYYDYKIPGGIWGNNPGYTQSPTGPNYCQTPYRECAGANEKFCANMVPLPGAPPCDPEKCSKLTDGAKPYCDASGCSKYKPCTTIPDYCPDGTCCGQFPPGCPNTLEQFFKYVGDLNTKAKQKGVKVVTSIALDGEDFGAYGTDKYGLVQAWQAARKYAPDVNEIGYAHGPHTRARENWTNASYPELYWIGELKSAINCIGCKEGGNLSDQTCLNCEHSIYQKYKNKPQEMLDAFDKYIKPIDSKDNALNLPGTCPLFSIELSHVSKLGIGPGKTCIKNQFDPKNWCGTFDGFGSWDWDAFESFMNLFSQKYNVKDLGIYEFQFVPPAWISQTASSPQESDTGFWHNASVGGKIGIVLGLLSVLTLLVVLVLLYIRRKK